MPFWMILLSFSESFMYFSYPLQSHPNFHWAHICNISSPNFRWVTPVSLLMMQIKNINISHKSTHKSCFDHCCPNEWSAKSKSVAKCPQFTGTSLRSHKSNFNKHTIIATIKRQEKNRLRGSCQDQKMLWGSTSNLKLLVERHSHSCQLSHTTCYIRVI